MSIRQNLYTAAGVVLSVVIAVSGWLLTSNLIDIKTRSLLSAAEIVQIDSSSDGTDSKSYQDDATIGQLLADRPKLSADEITGILASWESSVGSSIAHEPVEGQLGMEEAIQIGLAWLRDFSKQGVFPETLLESEDNKIYAYLIGHRQHGETVLSIDPSYSYWSFSFTNEHINAFLTINAITGQIWIADLMVAEQITYREINTEGIINAFVSHSGIDNDEKILYYSDKFSVSASKYLNNKLFASFTVSGRMQPTTDEKSSVIEFKDNYTSIKISLTVQEPLKF